MCPPHVMACQMQIELQKQGLGARNYSNSHIAEGWMLEFTQASAYVRTTLFLWTLRPQMTVMWDNYDRQGRNACQDNPGLVYAALSRFKF